MIIIKRKRYIPIQLWLHVSANRLHLHVILLKYMRLTLQVYVKIISTLISQHNDAVSFTFNPSKICIRKYLYREEFNLRFPMVESVLPICSHNVSIIIKFQTRSKGVFSFNFEFSASYLQSWIIIFLFRFFHNYVGTATCYNFIPVVYFRTT